MCDDARAPAERHPIEPPDFRRDGEIDVEQDQHRRHIGKEVHGELPRLWIDEDALAAPGLAQEKREGVGGDARAPADQNPGKPERIRGQPDIDPGANEGACEKGGKVNEEHAHRQVFEHALPSCCLSDGPTCRRGYFCVGSGALIEHKISTGNSRRLFPDAANVLPGSGLKSG